MNIQVSENIQLRKIQLSDSEEIFNTINNERKYLGKWLPFIENTKELSDSEKFVKAVVDLPNDTPDLIFTIRKNNAFIGLIGFKGTDVENKKTEIGYWLSEKFQKQGIMTMSVEKLCRFAFQELGINRIQIKCAIGNESSNKIPKRLNFMFEGIEREGELLAGGVFADLNVYSMLRKDFLT